MIYIMNDLEIVTSVYADIGYFDKNSELHPARTSHRRSGRSTPETTKPPKTSRTRQRRVATEVVRTLPEIVEFVNIPNIAAEPQPEAPRQLAFPGMSREMELARAALAVAMHHESSRVVLPRGPLANNR